MPENKRHIALFFVSEMEQENQEAKKILQEHSDAIELELVECNLSMKDLYTVPFIRDEDQGKAFYGLESIGRFLKNIRQPIPEHTRNGHSSQLAG